MPPTLSLPQHVRLPHPMGFVTPRIIAQFNPRAILLDYRTQRVQSETVLRDALH